MLATLEECSRVCVCVFVCRCVFTVSAVEFISLLSGHDFGRRNITSVFLKFPNNEEFFRSSRAFKGRTKFTGEVSKEKKLDRLAYLLLWVFFLTIDFCSEILRLC